jgi:hypothetical protein
VRDSISGRLTAVKMKAEKMLQIGTNYLPCKKKDHKNIFYVIEKNNLKVMSTCCFERTTTSCHLCTFS